jgi:hypothetical protein
MPKRAKKRSRRHPSPKPKQLSQRSDRLLYDVLMMGNTAALLDEDARWNDGWRELTQSMAVVESLLAHTRSLIEFLYPPKRVTSKNRRKRGEIFALDYCATGWHAQGGKELATLRKAIDRDIVHLSLAELPATRSGEYARLVATLRGAISAFLDDATGLPVQTRTAIRAALDPDRGPARAGDTTRVSMPIPAMPVPRRANGQPARTSARAIRPKKPAGGEPLEVLRRAR